MVTILSTAPSSFAGAAVAHYRTLQVLKEQGLRVICVVPTQDFRSSRSDFQQIEWLEVSYEFDAYPESERALGAALAEELFRQAVKLLKSGDDLALVATFLFPFGQAAIQAAELLKSAVQHVPLILIPAGSDIWQLGAQFPYLTSQILNSPLATSLVVYSASFAEELEAFTSRDLSVIPPPVWRDSCPTSVRSEVRNSLHLKTGNLLALCCSNMRPVKGLAVTLRLFEQVSNILDNGLMLLLVGPVTASLRRALNQTEFWRVPGPSGRYAWFAKGRNRVCCVGLQDDVAKFHLASDIAFNTSYHDSFNISLSESMAYGKPVVTSSCAGIAEAIVLADCGVVFDYMEISDVRASCVRDYIPICSERETTHRIASILSDPQTQAAMGARAQKIVEERFSREAVGDQWAELLGVILNCRRSL